MIKPATIAGLLLALQAPCIKAQSGKLKGSLVLGLQYQNLKLNNNTSLQQLYGLSASWFITKHWSLEYNISYASVPDNPNYLKAYAGSVLGTYAALQSINTASNNPNSQGGGGWWLLALFGYLAPEGISYHFILDEKTTLSPYINLLTVDLGINSGVSFANSAGVKLNFIVKGKLMVSPHVYGSVRYQNTLTGFGTGVAVRWIF